MNTMGINQYREDQKEIFIKCRTDAVKEILFCGIGFIVIIFIMKVLGNRTSAMVLSAIFGLIIAAGVLSYIFSLGMYLHSIFLWFKERTEQNFSFWDMFKYRTASMVIRFFEEAICLGFILILYALLFVPGFGIRG